LLPSPTRSLRCTGRHGCRRRRSLCDSSPPAPRACPGRINPPVHHQCHHGLYRLTNQSKVYRPDITHNTCQSMARIAGSIHPNITKGICYVTTPSCSCPARLDSRAACPGRINPPVSLTLSSVRVCLGPARRGPSESASVQSRVGKKARTQAGTRTRRRRGLYS
jgi:hypothetical protein